MRANAFLLKISMRDEVFQAACLNLINRVTHCHYLTSLYEAFIIIRIIRLFKKFVA